MEPITLAEMKSVKLMNRTDTKFVTNRRLLDELLRRVDDDYYVQTSDGRCDAPYHTLYYDTCDCNMYVVHHNGLKRRQKLRIRSYVESNLHFLEVKTKDNHGKTRKVRVTVDCDAPTLGSEAFGSRFVDSLLVADPIGSNRDFLNTNLRYDCDVIAPKIENSFTRMTLVNKLKTERLTIDTNLRYRNLTTGIERSLPEIAIIEIKRDSHEPSPMLPALNLLRIFPMGFSKYCIGMALTDPSLKRNLFKERLRIIEKL